MALVRVTALKDFRATALSTTDVSTGYQIAAVSSGQMLYAALHLTSASLGTTDRMLVAAVQSATASGFGGTVSTHISFALSTAVGAEWGSPVTVASTENLWWRASWTLSTGATTSGTWKGLVYMGIK